MLPSINIGFLSTYYLFYLIGILIGWVMFVAAEEDIYDLDRKCINLKTVFLASIAYFVVVIICIQGANWFHYFFDKIPNFVQRRLTWQDVVFTDLLGTVKVLYGAVFFYPPAIFIVSTMILRKNSLDYLNRKGFILFFILGFARLACFANGCCYGIYSKFFGVSFPMGSAASAEHMKRGLTHGFVPPPSLPVIPTQIISALVLFFLSFFCWRAYKKEKSPVLFFNYVFYYAIFRFLIEFIRDDFDRAYWYNLSASQWLSLTIFLLVALGFKEFKKKAHA
ncbi:MAG: diacylglyceryl transferase [Desulfobacteraceae bacterium]|nr:diacylglyceryl transferase [Desulfobacteraceae bacterium]